MSADDDSDEMHPRLTRALFGHGVAERALLDAYKSGRIPHAWLIGGPPGIGKATLAYRMASFVLAHPDPSAAEVQKAGTLEVDADNPAVRRIAGQSHPDLLVLERTLNDKGKLRQDIAVDDIRRSVPFFGSTAGEGGWRIAIVDAVEELNRAGANALLKILEEPPPRALMLLVSHSPGQTLATIRSRCRRLMLRPLEETDALRAVAQATGRSPTDPEIKIAVTAAGGSAGRALSLLDGPTLVLRQRVLDMLARLPEVDHGALHALGEALGGTDAKPLAAFVDAVNDWLSQRLSTTSESARKASEVALAFEKINSAARDVRDYNLERKPLVFAAFGLLAEAARG